MKVLIGTPAYGGLVYTRYLNSLIETLALCRQEDIHVTVMTLENESLITRGRNAVANEVLERKDVDKLFFIDADVSWQAEQFVKLVKSDKLIIGGTYPVKSLPLALNFNPPLDHLDFFSKRKTTTELKAYAEKFGKDGIVEMLHVPTGFMCIDASVLHLLKTKVRSYAQWDINKESQLSVYDYFQINVRDRYYESEDWFFCSLAKDFGIPVYLDTNVIVNHTGTYTFTKEG